MSDARLPGPPIAPFDGATRSRRLERLDEQPFDLAIIGGGITGAGIARDAAMRGLRTVLVERGDLASGTSSASSKLIHGGLRYLESREFGLVFESVSERHRLGQLAPHLVRPLPFLFPVYGGKPRPLWLVRAGLALYDCLALFRSHKLHRTLRRQAAVDAEPTLSPEGIDGAIVYYDCLTDDARLTLETARAAHEAGAWVLPYTEVVDIHVRRTQVAGLAVVDHHTGRSHELRARVVVNATGPWTDRTRGLRGERPRMLRPTKGVHVVVAAERLPVRHAVAMAAVVERNVFAIPWGDRVVIGTTDTDYDGDFDQVHADADDVRDLLGVANACFPGRDLGPGDVLGTWAGLRPLIADDGDTMALSRDHAIVVDEDGLVTVAGGKLTTYRRMAAEVVEVVADRLRAEGLHVGGCPTGQVHLPGGAGVAWRGDALVTLGGDGAGAQAELGRRLGEDVAQHLLQTYGDRWALVAARVAEAPELGRRLAPGHPYIWAEVDHAVLADMATTVRDVLRRRLPLELRGCDDAVAAATAVAERMGLLLGWDSFEVARQADLFRSEAGRSMAWRQAFGGR